MGQCGATFGMCLLKAVADGGMCGCLEHDLALFGVVCCVFLN